VKATLHGLWFWHGSVVYPRQEDPRSTCNVYILYFHTHTHTHTPVLNLCVFSVFIMIGDFQIFFLIKNIIYFFQCIQIIEEYLETY